MCYYLKFCVVGTYLTALNNHENQEGQAHRKDMFQKTAISAVKTKTMHGQETKELQTHRENMFQKTVCLDAVICTGLHFLKEDYKNN